jgi:hypothetical protein
LLGISLLSLLGKSLTGHPNQQRRTDRENFSFLHGISSSHSPQTARSEKHRLSAACSLRDEFFERESFATARNPKAAAGADTTQLSIALQLVLMLENVEYKAATKAR